MTLEECFEHYEETGDSKFQIYLSDGRVVIYKIQYDSYLPSELFYFESTESRVPLGDEWDEIKDSDKWERW